MTWEVSHLYPPRYRSAPAVELDAPAPSRLPARRRRPFWRLVGRSEGGCYWHAESHVRQGRTCRGGRPGSAAECRSRRTRAASIAACRLSVDGRAMSPARSARHGRLTADGQVPRVSVLPLPTIARPSFPFRPVSRPKVPGVGPSLRCGARRCICSNVSCGSRESNGLVVVSAPLGAYFVGNGARGPSAISAGALVRHGRRGAGHPDGRASASRARPTVMCAPPQRCLPLSHARVLLPSRRRARVLRAGAIRP